MPEPAQPRGGPDGLLTRRSSERRAVRSAKVRRDIFPGSDFWTPTFHCAGVGICALYWKVTMLDTGSGLSPVPSVDNCPSSRFCSEAVGGSPGVELCGVRRGNGHQNTSLNG